MGGLDGLMMDSEGNLTDGAGKKVSDTGAATVEIVLPFDKSGKGNVKVCRYHEGSVETPGTTTPGTPAGEPKNAKSPNTGDDSGLALWGIIALCALAVTFAVRRRRRTAKMFR